MSCYESKLLGNNMEDKMTLAEANIGQEYIVKDIDADDEELVDFLFSC